MRKIPIVYLPKRNFYGDTVLVEEMDGTWRVEPRSGFSALRCRASKQLSDKMEESFPRGQLVLGVDEGDGWIRCKIQKDALDVLECGDAGVQKQLPVPDFNETAATIYSEEIQMASENVQASLGEPTLRVASPDLDLEQALPCEGEDEQSVPEVDGVPSAVPTAGRIGSTSPSMAPAAPCVDTVISMTL